MVLSVLVIGCGDAAKDDDDDDEAWGEDDPDAGGWGTDGGGSGGESTGGGTDAGGDTAGSDGDETGADDTGGHDTGGEDAGGDGRITIFPTTGVEFGPFEAGHTKVGGFRIDSVGESSLRIISMSIIDAGENAGAAVFSGLRPHIEDHVVPFDISPGENAEFLLQATMEEMGTATGMIEIYTNDPTVDDPSPGHVRIPLSAVAVETSDSDSDDTGS